MKYRMTMGNNEDYGTLKEFEMIEKFELMDGTKCERVITPVEGLPYRKVENDPHVCPKQFMIVLDMGRHGERFERCGNKTLEEVRALVKWHLSKKEYLLAKIVEVQEVESYQHDGLRIIF